MLFREKYDVEKHVFEPKTTDCGHLFTPEKQKTAVKAFAPTQENAFANLVFLLESHVSPDRKMAFTVIFRRNRQSRHISSCHTISPLISLSAFRDIRQSDC